MLRANILYVSWEEEIWVHLSLFCIKGGKIDSNYWVLHTAVVHMKKPFQDILSNYWKCTCLKAYFVVIKKFVNYLSKKSPSEWHFKKCVLIVIDSDKNYILQVPLKLCHNTPALKMRLMIFLKSEKPLCSCNFYLLIRFQQK